MYYLKESGINAVHTYKELGYELDIYIPSKKAAIEYDGYYWHKDKSDNDDTIRCFFYFYEANLYFSKGKNVNLVLLSAS